MEAALIFPCILFVIFGLLYLGFYMHDKVRIQSVLDETALKGRALIENEAELAAGNIDYEKYLERGILHFLLNNDLTEQEAQIYDYAMNHLQGGLFLARIERIEVSAARSDIGIEVLAAMEFPFFEVKKLFTESGFSVKLNNITQIQNPMEFIRVFEVFSGAADKSAAVDKAIKNLQQLLNKIH